MSSEDRMAAEIVRQGRRHRLDDFDSEQGWLARCVADARDKIKSDATKQSGGKQ